ncbi:MAG: S24/S26 family peptidase, partial [Stackebrandtia sp.]
MSRGRIPVGGALLTATIVAAAAVAVAAWVRRNYVAITVDGPSMIPALRPGEKVLIRRGAEGVRRGRIVVVTRPDADAGWTQNPPAGRCLDAADWYVKRVVAVAGDPYPHVMKRSGVVPPGHVVVLGDHPSSEDSKRHGPCPLDQILGVDARRLEPEDLYAAAYSAEA